jgi:hypothetical protein
LQSVEKAKEYIAVNGFTSIDTYQALATRNGGEFISSDSY